MRIDIGDKNKFKKLLMKKYNLTTLCPINGLSLDSRTIEKNDIFLAINGNKVNGHNYVDDAKMNGASLIFCEEQNCSNSICISSNSIYKTVQDIAKEWRSLIEIPLLGITGSNGKTTTKELIGYILKNKINLIQSEKNYNSTISVPLCICSLNNTYDLSIIEMGASEPNEIQKLCDIAMPTMGIITNISNAHISSFKNIENIATTKSQLFSSLPSDGYAFKNIDDPFICDMETQATVVSYGFNSNADFSGAYDGEILKIDGNKIDIPFNNLEFAMNAIASYAVSRAFSIDSEYICQKIANFIPPPGRNRIFTYRDITVIDDTYNANLLSAKSGINLLNNYPGNRKIAIIGDMLELGKYEIYEHEKLGDYINQQKIDIVIAIGVLTPHSISKITSHAIQRHYFETMAELNDFVKKLMVPGDIVYIKGSRSMSMDQIIKENFS